MENIINSMENKKLATVLQCCNSDPNLPLSAKNELFRLAEMSQTEGLNMRFPLSEVPESQEDDFRTLKKHGYIDLKFQTSGLEGHYFDLTLHENPPQIAEIAKKSNESMHDSGQKEVFESGAVRDSSDGKCRPDLFSPFALEKIGDWLRKGAEKYTPRNWESGIPVSRCLASLCRHLMKYQQNADDGEDHIAAVMCNAMFILHISEMVRRGVLPESLLDMPRYKSAPPKKRYTTSTIPSVHRNGDVEDSFE